jgi:hypothetical protein
MTAVAAARGVANPMESVPSFTEHYVPTEQGRVYARDYKGTGPSFVLMHGFPDNSTPPERTLWSVSARC